MAYYYLAAQLPYLVYGQPSPMKPEDFKALCVSKLSPEDAALLEFCTLDPDFPQYGGEKDGAEFIGKWRRWERALRLNLARHRAGRVKREGAAPVEAPDDPADAAAAAKAAVALESPLEAELFLDSARWRAIEAFQGIDYFSRDTFYAYLLKLLLLERRSSFKVEEGFAEYKGLYAAVMEKAAPNA